MAGTGERLEATIRRFGLVATGVICWKGATTIWASGGVSTYGTPLVLMLGAYLLGLALLVLTAANVSRRVAYWTIPVALLVVCLCYAITHRVAEHEGGVPLTTDAYMFTDYAARLLRAGENPYAHDLMDAFRVHRAPFSYVTPLLSGDVSGRVAYPALHFLLFVPFQMLGVHTGWIYPFLGLAVLAVLYIGAAR
ncbi:MAG: hypothetical protein JRI55_19940, partial [Deltaproteobacteria bacterium]|nr:hypothetical protein [Deltaproteobacteria bacterium]